MSEIAAPHLDRWYTYDQLTEYLHALESAFGERCRLSSIGRSLEGRELWMLEVTDLTGGDPEQRPGYIVQANIHAKEVAGTNSSLTLIWDLLANTPEDIDTHALLREVTFYIIPRINPDGAEFALTGGEIRSRREDLREPNCIYQADVDGDGAIVDMRVERPDGGWKASPDDPRIMIAREPGDREGTFYAVYTEGLVHDPDGCDPGYAARSHDFNRNWPANWHQEHEQPGAGDYPFSEPEMRAFADFVYSHPNIFGALGFHCGSSAVLMPPSAGSVDDIAPADLRVFEELGQRAAELTDLKSMPTINYATKPPIALKGHSADWGYQHMGLFHFEIEQGNIYNAAGIRTEDFFAQYDASRTKFTPEIMRYHDEHPEQEMFVDWHEVEHPQLGRVEVGGWKKYWMINPSFETLREWIAPGSSRFIIEYAARHARLEISDLAAEEVGGGIYRVRARVMNSGGFPTNITQRALALKSLKPVTAELVLPEGAELLSQKRHFAIGQLAPHARSAQLEWFVRCEPGTELTVSTRSQRAGVAERSVACRSGGAAL